MNKISHKLILSNNILTALFKKLSLPSTSNKKDATNYSRCDYCSGSCEGDCAYHCIDCAGDCVGAVR